MTCKLCGAHLEDDMAVCPLCGAPRDPDEHPQPAAPAAPSPVDAAPEPEAPAPDAPAPAADTSDPAPSTDEPAPEAPASDPDEPAPAEAEAPAPEVSDTPDGSPDTPAPPPPEAAAPAEAPREKRRTRPVVFLVAALAAVAVLVLACVALLGGRSDAGDGADTADTALSSTDDETDVQEPGGTASDPAGDSETEAPEDDPVAVLHVDESGAFVAHAYAKPAEEVTAEEVAAVVATCGNQELTNGQLSFYFWQQYFSFLNTYGSYAAFFGLDSSQPLSEQMYSETQTWEDFFLQEAVRTFWQVAAVGRDADEAGYQLDEATTAYLETLRSGMEQEAEANGYTVDEYVQTVYGPHVTLEDYMAFGEGLMRASGYLSQLFGSIEYTDEDVEAYLADHADDYAAQGAAVDDPNLVDVRHILIMPQADEDAELDENGNPVLTEQNWTDARVKAEEIYDIWQSGEATEESFAELAREYSEDGSASNGGLIEEIRPGQMVETFNDWCFDESRQPGDHGIVESPYGYHIMYFSATRDYNYARSLAEQDYVSARQEALLNGILDGTPITVDYSVVVLPETVQ